VGVPVKKLYSN